jgi:uncharacterized protein (TIGR02145 family)
MSVNSNGYIHFGGDIRNIYILLLLSLSFGTVTDIDGNVYETIQIGEQLWMAQNLKVTHYNNGDEMPNLTINNDWTSASIGAYSDYDNNPTNSETYGKLYNWYTVNDERGICPEGYHVPSDDEYSELEVYLGMSESETDIIGFRGTNEGSKLAGNSELWNIGVLVIDPEFGTSGFDALPAGYRVYSSGDFDTVGKHCYFWSSSENSNSHAWYRNLLYFNTRVYRNSPSKQSGFSIRCLADEITTGCTDSNACNYNPAANVENGSCMYPECSGECYGEVTISNLWSDGYHYDFTYTLGELTDYEGQLLGQIAQKEIINLTVTCQETGQVWSFDSDRISGGNGNHDFSFLQERYEDFPLPARDITNGVLIGIDTYSTGNYHSLWFSVTAVDDEGNEFTHDNYVDPNPYGWNLSNEITFPGLYFTGVVDYANLDVLYAEGSFPVAGITYQIEGGGHSEGFACEETCEGSLSGSDCENSIAIDLHEGSNLMSFSLLPEDNSVGNVLSNYNIMSIAGEGEAALNTANGWVGSLTTILYENGYWLQINETDMLTFTGIPIQSNQLYELHMGNNLISYPLSECGNIDEVLPDEIEGCIYAIAGEGVAALNTDAGWVGSLTELCPNDGYWFVSDCEIDFTYDEPQSLARKTELSPSPYPYRQSSMQAFYFIESVENIEIGDWILSFNGDKVIGAREWLGSIIGVPAMGDDGSGFTAGYIQTGQIPTFKLLKDGKLINLEGDIPAFENNQLYMVTSLSGATALPETFSLDRAYPNPFNPVTTLRFALPIETQVSIQIYNLQGRQVISLVDGNIGAGYHSVVWNADSHSSGVYFIKMVSGEYVKTQKLMLVK